MVHARTDGERRRHSRTSWLKFSAIQSDRHGVLLARLAMAVNDIYLANWSMLDYQKDKLLDGKEEHLKIGALQYFVRLQCGHLNEGLKLIREFQRNSDLVDRISRCSTDAHDAYGQICDCLPGGKDYQRLIDTIGRLRNKVTFHYDSDQVQRALEYLANEPRPQPATITIGEDYYLTRFNFADRIADTILTRQILGIPPAADKVAELALFEAFLNEKCLSFLRFTKEFVTLYLEEKAPA